MTRNRELNDETAARLLSGRDAPSVLEKERLFERILAQVLSEPRRWPARYWKPLAFACSGALCLLALLLWRPGSDFAARGEGSARGPSFRPWCVGGNGAQCKSGDALGFEVTPRDARPYFAAFARRADGAIVWYFPDPNGLSLHVDQGAQPILDRGVALGSEHPAGHYEVYGVFSAKPLSRAQIRAALGDDLNGSKEVSVVRRAFEVEP